MKFVGAMRSAYGHYKAMVEMSADEFRSITGRDIRIDSAVTGTDYDVQGMWYALRDIAQKSSDVKRMRASMRAFLDLTEDQRILDVMEKCGVAEKVVEPPKEQAPEGEDHGFDE